MPQSTDSSLTQERERHRVLVQLLFVQQAAALRGFLLALVADYQLVDDLMQEVFLTVTAKAGDFEPGTNFTAWVRCISRYKVMEARRRRRNAPITLSHDLLELLCDEEPAPGPPVANEEAMHHLRLCLAKLPPKSRKLVHLRYYEQLAPGDVAQRLGWTAQAVYVALSRARTALRCCVSKRMKQEAIICTPGYRLS